VSRTARAAPGSACDAARARASLELDGLLDEVGLARLRRHVATCPDCARVVAAMRATTRQLRTATLEPWVCFGRRRTGTVAQRHQSWAGVAAAVVALGIGTASLPGAADGPSALDRAKVVAASATEPSERPRLPIGQRSAREDFVIATAPLQA
jgi:anti-sigma factor RsiW